MISRSLCFPPQYFGMDRFVDVASKWFGGFLYGHVGEDAVDFEPGVINPECEQRVGCYFGAGLSPDEAFAQFSQRVHLFDTGYQPSHDRRIRIAAGAGQNGWVA